MAKAFQKIYTQITAITKATCSLKAEGVGNDELATVNGKLAQVVKIIGDDVTLQVFQGTEGIPTNAEVVFLGKSPSLKVSDQLAGRFFNAYGEPIDGGPQIEGKEIEIGGPSVHQFLMESGKVPAQFLKLHVQAPAGRYGKHILPGQSAVQAVKYEPTEKSVFRILHQAP